MSLDIQFRALQQWPKQPTPNYKRRKAPFTASYAKTVDLLETELKHLRAKNVMIEADCDRSEIRIDGHLRSGAKLRGPGIVLRFDAPSGSMTFPCDTFADWQDNLRAIALALEALRKVDRYGVTSSGEQYRGWQALPDKSQTGLFPDVASALAWLQRTIHEPMPAYPWNDACRELVRKQAVLRCHPDRNGGNDETWRQWTQAANVLGIEV